MDEARRALCLSNEEDVDFAPLSFANKSSATRRANFADAACTTHDVNTARWSARARERAMTLMNRSTRASLAFRRSRSAPVASRQRSKHLRVSTRPPVAESSTARLQCLRTLARTRLSVLDLRLRRLTATEAWDFHASKYSPAIRRSERRRSALNLR